MKKLLCFTLLLSAAQITLAQWSNTSNLFYDSLHMAVSTPVLTQKNVIIVNSFPDNGFFVIWEDERNLAGTNTDIYAQKYDKDGNPLWAVNGAPVCNTTNRQHYTFASNQDYRNRSFAATDSAGGFYITYADDSISSYVYERVMVQHMLANGNTVFPGSGYIISRSGGANYPTTPQLIADGNKGFFVAWKNTAGNDYVYAYCYRDVAGTLQSFGGGRLNDNAIETSSIAPCGIKTDLYYPGTTVFDFNIWSDRDKGCNVIMNLNGNTGSQYKMLGYNRLWRAKKNALIKSYFRNTSGIACPQATAYDSGQVYPLYVLKSDFQNVACGSTPTVYAYTNYRLLSNGFQLIDQGGYDYNYPKGVTLGTNGNINIDMIAVTRRSYTNNVLSDFSVQGYLYKSEKFDSVPFQRASFSNPELGFNPIQPAGLNKLTFQRDTLLAFGNSYPDFSLSGGGSDIYAAAVMSNTGSRKVLLQHLTVTKLLDSFAVQYKTNLAGQAVKAGMAIGSELNTGFGGTDIFYDLPLISTNDKGTAVFYIRENGRGARISPIGKGTDLIWGAMGIPVGSGTYNNSYYNFEQPYVALDSTGSKGLIAWRDNRTLPGNSADNIFMRHLDQLDQTVLYSPPHKRVRLLTNPYSPGVANPAVMYGTSNEFSRIDIYNTYGADPGISPVVDIFDNNYLGRVQISAYQYTGAIRRYNNEAYLSRNYTIKTDSTPPGASIDMKLYFSKQEFDALKGTDNAILDPGYLMAIRQPNTSGSINAPASYTPVAGEEILPADSWDSVGGGGYAIQVRATGLGHFFIKKMTPVTACGASATSFTSDRTSASYLWMVKAPGSANFTMLNDDANYTGTKTATLHITNILPSFNSYLYRCLLADLSVSKTFYLQVINQWTGAVNNLWENPANWSCGKVPDASTDVILTSGTITVNSNATCRSLKVSTGATVTVTPGFSLTVVH
jgi:hypothetical protein